MTALAKFTWAVVFLSAVAIATVFITAIAARLVYEAALFGWSVIG